MIRSNRAPALALGAALLAGCAGMDETRQTTAAGATMGALGGAVIGSPVNEKSKAGDSSSQV